MRTNLCQAMLGVSLLALMGCSGGGDSTATTTVTGGSSKQSSITPLFDPAASKIPLPNVLLTAMAADPLTGRAANTPMTPPEALAYVNKYEMGSTNAVAGMNAPIYLQFTAAVDAATVTAANIKVFQLTPDAAGTETSPLGFKDVSGLFSYRYAAGSTNLLMFPNFPLLPGTRYLYVVTNRVKDTTGLPLSSALPFQLLKQTSPLTGAYAALEPIRGNVMAGTAVLFSGYAKVMDDLITAKAVTTINTREDITLMGRFITSGAGYIPMDASSATAAAASRIPVETALRAFALGSNPIPPYPAGTPQGLSGKVWSHTATIPANDFAGQHYYTFVKGTALSPDAYWTAVMGAPTAAPATVGLVALGTINSADLSMDPVVVAANSGAAGGNLTGIAGAYNPAAGVLQPVRTAGALTSYYHTDRPVNFVYIAPAGTAPVGGWPLVIYQHGITSQKETVIALAQSLTAIGRAVIAIDLPLHGQLAVPGHTTGDVWGADLMAVGAPLATRSNVQQAAFNLNRLEFTVRFGGFATALGGLGLGGYMPVYGPAADIKFVGISLGSIVGTYYLAGATTLNPAAPAPYTQETLNADMKGYLSVPGGRTAYVIQNSPAFGPSVDAGLAAVGIVKNSPTYHQFFQVTQSVVDPVDPATMTTPLGAGLPSRLSNRVVIQEATTTTFDTALGSDGLPKPTNGDMVIGNPYTRYFGNALGGREVLGNAAASATAPEFKQLAYTAGGTPPHAAGVAAPFMFTLNGAAPAPKVGNAAVTGADTTPTEGYFQFDQAEIGHSSLLSPANMTNLLLIQKQVRYFLGLNLVVDPTQGAPALPVAPIHHQDVLVPAQFPIFAY